MYWKYVRRPKSQVVRPSKCPSLLCLFLLLLGLSLTLAFERCDIVNSVFTDISPRFAGLADTNVVCDA